MDGSEPLNWRSKSYETEKSGHDTDTIKTRALPVTSTQVQPHAELVECEGQAHPVDHSRNRQCTANRATEQQIGSDAREKKDAVVQVMYMCSPKMEVEVW